MKKHQNFHNLPEKLKGKYFKLQPNQKHTKTPQNSIRNESKWERNCVSFAGLITVINTQLEGRVRLLLVTLHWYPCSLWIAYNLKYLSFGHMLSSSIFREQFRLWFLVRTINCHLSAQQRPRWVYYWNGSPRGWTVTNESELFSSSYTPEVLYSALGCLVRFCPSTCVMGVENGRKEKESKWYWGHRLAQTSKTSLTPAVTVGCFQCQMIWGPLNRE